MSFTVYCFNDAYPLYLFLNGLKSFLGSSEWSGYLFMVASVALLFGILAVKQIDAMGYFRAYTAPILLFHFFLAQPAQLRLEDQWANEAYSVDDIPIAIALPLHVTSSLEQIFVELVDTHMSPPVSTSFREFDFFLEAAALSEVLNGQALGNIELQSSISQYYEDCILKGMSTGFVSEASYYKSSNLLLDSYMPWGVYFTQVYPENQPAQVMTCEEAYTQFLSPRITGESASTAQEGIAGYMQHLFGGRFQSTYEVTAAMDNLASFMFPGYQSTSEALFQQAFMINGIQSNLAQTNPQILAAISQAEVSQATGIASASAIYIKKLPKLRAMLKLAIVGLAPIVAAFFIAQNGRPAVQWAAALLWVSMWLPMMGVIKATYVASAVNELQTMVLSTGGVTIPNKLRIMTWISDTSTVAGTLGFMIPSLAGIVLQLIAPKLAAGIVSGFVAGSRTSEGFAQRAGMSALSGAERSAKELELDKMNQAFMEAGDVQLARQGRMNDLVGQRTNVAIGNEFGSSPMGTGGSHLQSLAGTGYTIAGGMSAGQEQTLQSQVQQSQARATLASSTAAHQFASGIGTDKSESDFNRVQNSMSEQDRTAFDQARQHMNSKVAEAMQGMGYSGEQVAAVQRSVSAAAYAGAKIDSTGSVLGSVIAGALGASGSAGVEGRVTATMHTGEAERIKQDASQVAKALSSDQNTVAYSQSRAQSLEKANSYGHGSDWRETHSQSESFTQSVQRAESYQTEARETLAAASQQKAALGANSNFSIATGTLAAYAQRGDLEALSGVRGMNALRDTLHNNPSADIDKLRRAASGDLGALVRSANDGDKTARTSAIAALESLAGNKNYFHASNAAQAAGILKMQGELVDKAKGGLGIAATIKPIDTAGLHEAGSELQSKLALWHTAGANAKAPEGGDLSGAYTAAATNMQLAGEGERAAIFNDGQAAAAGTSFLNPEQGTIANAGNAIDKVEDWLGDSTPGFDGKVHGQPAMQAIREIAIREIMPKAGHGPEKK